MDYHDVDAFFVMASMGDNYAYRKIYEYFYNESMSVAKSVLSNFKSSHIDCDEFTNVVSLLFIEAINHYDYNRAPFSLYIKYLIQLRFVRKIVQFVESDSEKAFSLDDCVDGETTYYDVIAGSSEQNEKFQTSLKNFKYTIASKSRSGGKKQKLFSNVKLLLYCGYSQEEMAKILNITRNDVRKLIKECKTDDSIIDLKLEMK